MILLSLGLGIHLIGKEEVKRIFISIPDTVISPTIYNKITEDYNLETTTDVSYYDTIYTFNSGVKTLIPKKLLAEIKDCVEDIMRGNETILPPPRINKNKDTNETNLNITWSPRKSTFFHFYQKSSRYQKPTREWRVQK